MTVMTSLHCGNCGTALDMPPEGAPGVDCPVCGLFNDMSALPQAVPITSEALEQTLGALIVQARAGGLDNEEIVRVLRDELEFAAELANSGRHLFIQIIDLGPREEQAAYRPARDRTSVLRGRAVGR